MFMERDSKLIEYEKLLRLLEHPAAILDTSGEILMCNPVFGTRLQRTCAEFLGRDLRSFLDPHDRKALDAMLNAISLDPTGVHEPLTVMLQTDVDYLHCTLSRFPEQGKFRGLLCQSASRKSIESIRLQYLMENLDQGVWDYDIRRDHFVVSQAWRKMRGVGPDFDVNQKGNRWQDNVHPEDIPKVIGLLRKLSAQHDQSTEVRIELRYRHADGHWIWMRCRGRAVAWARDGRPSRIIGTDEDISEQKETGRALNTTMRKLQMAIDTAGVGIWEFDPDRKVLRWDSQMLSIFGIKDDVSEQSFEDWVALLHPEDREREAKNVQTCLVTGCDYKSDYRIIRPDGETRYVRSLARTAVDGASQPWTAGVCIDVTEDYLRSELLEEARAQMEFDSRHDALTGLANRRRMDEEVTRLFETIDSETRYAVLHLDVDHFKQVNDALGHDAGDAVLFHIAAIIEKGAGPDALTARIGGDEFSVLYRSAPSTEDLERICGDIIEAAKKPFTYNGIRCEFGLSIGCAVGQGQDPGKQNIFMNADTALYAAKQAGRGRYRIFDKTTTAQVKAEVTARQDILEAISRREFVCHFQPQFCTKTEQMIGAEALIRWNHPDHGILPTTAFMPLIEKYGLSDKVDACAFEYVTDQQNRWHRAGLEFPPISLNVSKDRLFSASLREDLERDLRPHHKLTFELLESVFADEVDDDLHHLLNILREKGVGVDLNDFGAGNTSIAAMQAVKPDRVKISRKLVAPILIGSKQISTLHLLCQMVRVAEIGIVVEGVETPEYVKIARDFDCDALQGFALGLPTDVDAFEDKIRAAFAV